MTVPKKEDLLELLESFHEVKTMLNKYDQFFQYKELWGDGYGEKVETLWEKHIHLFKKSELPESSWQEATLIISFDYYLGANVGLPEDVKLNFYNWLIADMRRQLGYDV